MAITFVGAGTLVSSNVNGATVTVPWPSAYTPTSGDVAVVVSVGRHAGPSSVACPTPVAGVNFSLIATSFRDVGASDLETTVFYKVLDGTETTVTYTNTSTFSTTGNGIGSALAVYRGLDIVDVASVTSNTAAVTTWTPTGITTSQYAALILSAVGSADDNSLGLDSGNEQGFSATNVNPLLSFGFSGSAYNVTPFTNDAAIGLAGKVVNVPGSVTMPTWRQNQLASDATASVTIAIRVFIEADGSALSAGSVDRVLDRKRTASGSAVGLGDVDIKLSTKREADG